MVPDHDPLGLCVVSFLLKVVENHACHCFLRTFLHMLVCCKIYVLRVSKLLEP